MPESKFKKNVRKLQTEPVARIIGETASCSYPSLPKNPARGAGEALTILGRALEINSLISTQRILQAMKETSHKRNTEAHTDFSTTETNAICKRFLKFIEGRPLRSKKKRVIKKCSKKYFER